MTISRILAARFAAVALAAAGLAGCDKGGSAGGPGTATATKPPLFGQADDTFKITAPSVSIKQGNVHEGSIGIKRGTNFDQDVALAFEDLPKGIALDPAKPVILGKATDAKFKLTAGDDSLPGEYTVKVIGHPATGGDATNQFKLTVAPRDTFTLSMPFWTTALKQGESKSVTIAIARDKQFDQDVTIKFEGLSKGMSVEPTTAVIKNGEKEAKFILKAADDAALGDFAIKVTGHPTKGADATHDFKFAVAKK